MPIVKVSDDGKESIIDAAADARRKRNAKIGASAAVLGAVISFGLFFLHSPEAGIFAGLWPATLCSLLNLIDD
tara:strand:- start:89 stop:307 length:219 start_codon:yes stop_codon:yes gene_type:complete